MSQQVTAAASSIALFTTMESDAYAAGHRSTYFMDHKALFTAFIDGAERSPTFRLFALDTINEAERKCWFQVCSSPVCFVVTHVCC